MPEKTPRRRSSAAPQQNAPAAMSKAPTLLDRIREIQRTGGNRAASVAVSPEEQMRAILRQRAMEQHRMDEMSRPMRVQRRGAYGQHFGATPSGALTVLPTLAVADAASKIPGGVAEAVPAALDFVKDEWLDFVAGALLGEWNEDPTLGMIALDTGVSLIPLLDQASDLRDLAAHAYFLIGKGQYTRPMRWVGLAFSLIGLFPAVGSAIKGASKFLIKGGREALSHLRDLLEGIRRVAPDVVDFAGLRRYLDENWSSFVASGLSRWNSALDDALGLLDRLPGFLPFGQEEFAAALARVRSMSPAKLTEAFDWIKMKIDDVLDDLSPNKAQQPKADIPASSIEPRTGDDEFRDFRDWLNKESSNSKFEAAGEPVSLQPHSAASRARELLGVTGEHQSAHGLTQAVGRSIPWYSPGAALTLLLERSVHSGMDRYFNEAFIAMRQAGRTNASAAEIYAVIAESIQRSPDLPSTLKETLKLRLSDEMFVDLGLPSGFQITLPNPNIKPKK